MNRIICDNLSKMLQPKKGGLLYKFGGSATNVNGLVLTEKDDEIIPFDYYKDGSMTFDGPEKDSELKHGELKVSYSRLVNLEDSSISYWLNISGAKLSKKTPEKSARHINAAVELANLVMEENKKGVPETACCNASKIMSVKREGLVDTLQGFTYWWKITDQGNEVTTQKWMPVFYDRHTGRIKAFTYDPDHGKSPENRRTMAGTLLICYRLTSAYKDNENGIDMKITSTELDEKTQPRALHIMEKSIEIVNLVMGNKDSKNQGQ